jgi:hypothetical protein
MGATITGSARRTPPDTGFYKRKTENLMVCLYNRGYLLVIDLKRLRLSRLLASRNPKVGLGVAPPNWRTPIRPL